VTSLPPIRALALLCAVTTLYAQQTDVPAKPASTANDVAFPVAHDVKAKPRTPRPAEPALSFDTIVLDPAHGGSDTGARIGDDLLEKDLNLAFANKLKQMLTDRGLTVVMTRTTDAIIPKAAPAAVDADGNPVPQAAPKPVDITPDQIVETANRAHAFACLILHAANGGHGVHLYTSSLAPRNAAQTVAPMSETDSPIIPWDTAQSAALANSERLATDLSAAINNIRVPLVAGHSSVRPIDSMTCPAIAIEIAPLSVNDHQTPASDDAYQQRVAEAIVSGIVAWRGHAQALEAAIQSARAINNPAAETTAPARKAAPKPKPITPPVEVPAETTPRKPAPIIQRVPPPVPPPGERPGATR
jgi:N-acetylmuramoyl-L-alanine amidase